MSGSAKFDGQVAERVWVCGHNGMVGSAVARHLKARGTEVLTVARSDLDLRDAAAVLAWVGTHRPDRIIVAAGTVGGIAANLERPADFIFDNLAIATSVIEAARRVGCRKLAYLAASCIYPRDAEQPLRESSLLTGPLEPTNQPYAVAKIAGIQLCSAYRRQYGVDFISVVPPNIYGPGQHMDPAASHVCGGLMNRIHHAHETGAETVTVWGSGRPTREFLYIDDLAVGLLTALDFYSDIEPINIGSGHSVSIYELSKAIASTIGYKGNLVFDVTKPDGMMQKALDGERIRHLGWVPTTSIQDGLKRTYEWYRSTLNSKKNLDGVIDTVH